MKVQLHSLTTLQKVATIEVDDATGAVSVVEGDAKTASILCQEYANGFDFDKTVWDADGNPGCIGASVLPSQDIFEQCLNRHLKFEEMCTASKAESLRLQQTA